MKFGGTSVADAGAFARIVGIVRAQQSAHPLLVVSAMSGFTDALLDAVSKSACGDRQIAIESLEKHFTRHLAVAEALDVEVQTVVALLDTARTQIAHLLVKLTTPNAPFALLQDEIVSYGERLSSALLANVLSSAGLPATHVDARRCVLTDQQHGHAEPLTEKTALATRNQLGPLISANQIPVLGGFIGATPDGVTTTLGRGGSDYSAALIGAALEATEVQIWTDVPGILTADPRVIADAQPIARLSYDEAAELAYFGAKVLHPKTIQPAVEQDIPVRICNSRAPEDDGTIVGNETEISPVAVKALAHKTGITLVQITSARMLGAHGFLHAIFEIFNRHRTVIDIVTTSEVSVSLSLDDASSLPVIVPELEKLGDVHVETGRAVICVVGEGLRGTPGIAARVFGCLGDINVSLISQGASRINLTFVVEEKRVEEALFRLHQTFFRSELARTVEAAA